MMTSHRIHAAVARVRSPRAGGRRDAHGLRQAFGELRIVTQPIVSVSTGAVLAHEALARFSAGRNGSGLNTESVFARANASGQGPLLEAECLRAALALRAHLPDAALLTVNVSPNALPFLAGSEFWPDDLRGVIVEVTEQDIENPADLDEHLDGLRERGAAIAVDDVSTGYAGLLRLAHMRPDYVKVDRQVVSGVGSNPAQAAVLESLVMLSHRLGAAVIGEGVEDLYDLDALAQFDVDYAQGYAIAEPGIGFVSVASEVVGACRTSRRRVLRKPGTPGHAAALTRDVYAVTAALATAGERSDLNAALAASAADLGVDVVGVSVLGNGLTIREIASTGDPLDARVYALTDYPATLAVLNGAGTVEVQVGDPVSDPAERELLERLGHQSLLLVPVDDGDATIGVLEFAHRTPRRWSALEIAHAQGLARHVAPVLKRLGVGDDVPAALTA